MGQKDNDSYRVYWGIRDRCYNPKSKTYYMYGARGVEMCDRWLKSFDAFNEDMGPRPSKSHTIDRKDSNGNYEPGNCRWATGIEQNSNRCCCRFITHNGERLTHSAWARRVGITREAMRIRVNRLEAIGADVTQAVTTPAGEIMPAFNKQSA